MTDKERNALIPLPAGGLENIGSGPKNILSGMVSDALALARVQEKPPMDCLTFPSGDRLTRARILEAKRFLSATQIITSPIAARFRIGNYEFRDPDYRQILLWAKALGIEPGDFVQSLENSAIDLDGYVVPLEVDDGSIVSLSWDFDTFPISSFEWVDGLKIKHLEFHGLASTEISLCLPLLNWLDCQNIGLTKLDLSNVPVLTKLWCNNNELAKLDLSNVPGLIELSCESNQLAQLDLSNVPELTELLCSCNRLAELNLSNIPGLTKLWCGSNPLTELDLSNVPGLTELWCSYSRLVELDLSNVSLLKVLWCGSNPLTELDLSNVPVLTKLLCENNLLAELNLSNVTGLTKLRCENNPITELDIRRLEKLTKFSCDPSVILKKLPTQNF